MATRHVTGTIIHPTTGQPWASAPVVWSLRGVFATASATYPTDTVTVHTDASGQFAIDVAVPDSGDTVYLVALPDGQVFALIFGAGAPTTLEALLNSSASISVPPNVVQAAIDAALFAHINASNPHVQYLRVADADARYLYEHIQSSASAQWIVNHNFGRYPEISLLNTGSREFEGEVVHLSLNQARVYLSAPLAGRALCR